jgi:ABC-type transporter Mla maintaining outer membrane lipid asymmetry ATPase subunit MlaF
VLAASPHSCRPRPEQQAAVKLALTEKVAVLTGGPGCGKSFTVRSIVALVAAKRTKIVLAAPTGRAAKRLAELTGHDAAWGAGLVVHGGDLRHRWTVAVGHDRRSWRYDCCI